MSRIQILRTDDFTGGLNLRADPFQLGKNESPDMLNVDIDPRGGFAMRGGMERYNTSAIGGIGAGLFTPKKMYVWQSTAPQILLAANSTVYWSASGTFADTTIATTAAHGASFAAWSGATQVVYVATGNGGACSKWDGAADTALTASGTAAWQDSYASPIGTHMPKSDHVTIHVDRAWVANTVENGTAFPDRIRFSHQNFPESWREIDYIDIVDGGSGITALVPYGDALYVFKRHSIHVVYGIDSDTFQVQRLSDQVGTISPLSVATTERGMFFFSWPDGVYRVSANAVIDLFAPLRPIIQRGDVSETNLARLHVGFVNRRLWVSIPQGSSVVATYSYVYDASLGKDGSWTKYQTADLKGVAACEDYVTATGTRVPLAVHPTEPYVLKVDQDDIYQDDVAGTPANFTSYYTTKWLDAGNISSRKMWRRPDMVVKQPTVPTSLYVDCFHNWEEALVKRSFVIAMAGSGEGLVWNASGAEPDGIDGWGDTDWGSAAVGGVFERGSNLGLARAVQMKISGPGGLPWGVSSISYKFNPRRIRA